MASGLAQWRVLTQRTLEILVRNRLTLAILLGSPALVVAMFVILFRPGAFDFDNPSPSSMVMIGSGSSSPRSSSVSRTACCRSAPSERSCAERLVGLRPGPYVASKVTILAPFLVLVVAAMLGVLRLFDRLPERPLTTYASIGVSCCCARCCPRSRTAHVRDGQDRLAGHARSADAVLPRRAVLRCDPPGSPDGERRRRLQPGDAIAGPSRAWDTTSARTSSPRVAHRSGNRCSPPTVTLARCPPARTGSFSPPSR